MGSVRASGTGPPSARTRRTRSWSCASAHQGRGLNSRAGLRPIRICLDETPPHSCSSGPVSSPGRHPRGRGAAPWIRRPLMAAVETARAIIRETEKAHRALRGNAGGTARAHFYKDSARGNPESAYLRRHDLALRGDQGGMGCGEPDRTGFAWRRGEPLPPELAEWTAELCWMTCWQGGSRGRPHAAGTRTRISCS